MRRDGRLKGHRVDLLVHQRRIDLGLQQQGVLIAQPLGGPGAARGDGLEGGGRQAAGSGTMQQSGRHSGFAHTGVGAGYKKGASGHGSPLTSKWDCVCETDQPKGLRTRP